MKNKFVFFLTIGLILGSPSLANIRILNPWVSASTGPNAILFMEIENTGDTPDKLITVKASQTSRTEFHNHVDIGNGSLHMEKIDYIEVPARGYTQLRSGGKHVMLRNIHGSLQVGDIVQLSLGFESGETIHVNAPVRAMGSTD